MSSKKHFRSFLVDDAVATIRKGDLVSEPLDLEGVSMCGLYLPDEFVGEKVTFYASTKKDGEYFPVCYGDGSKVEMVVSRKRYCLLLSDFFIGVRHIKIASNEAQVQDAEIKFAARPI